MPITEQTTGLIENLDNDEYHADRIFVSSSGLKLLDETCPNNYKHFYIDDYKRIGSLSKNIGSASHTNLLENFKFGNEYFVGLSKADYPDVIFNMDQMKIVLKGHALKTSGKRDDLIKRIKEDGRFKLEFWQDVVNDHNLANEGKIQISPEQMEIVQGINDSVSRNSHAMELLSESRKEISLFGRGQTYPDIRKKCRFDLLGDNWFGDFKTAASASLEYFQSSVYKFYYDLSFAMYTDLYKEEFGDWPKDIWAIVAETKPPYNVSVFNVGDDIMYYGQCRYEDSLQALDECRFSGQWPGYQGNKKFLELNYPGWAYRKLEALYGTQE